MPAGRPTKLTPQLRETLLETLRGGATRTAAVAHVGTTLEALRRWMANSVEFRGAIEQAEAHAELRCSTTIVDAIVEGDTANARWWLERRRPQDWGKVDRVEITIRQHAEKLAAELGLSADELIAEAERILKGAA